MLHILLVHMPLMTAVCCTTSQAIVYLGLTQPESKPWNPTTTQAYSSLRNIRIHSSNTIAYVHDTCLHDWLIIVKETVGPPVQGLCAQF